MHKSAVTCVGGANIDVQGFSNAPVNMRDSNPGVIRLCPGGVGRNIAENLAFRFAHIDAAIIYFIYGFFCEIYTL